MTEYHSNLLMVKLVSAHCLLCVRREMGTKSVHSGSNLPTWRAHNIAVLNGNVESFMF